MSSIRYLMFIFLLNQINTRFTASPQICLISFIFLLNQINTAPSGTISFKTFSFIFLLNQINTLIGKQVEQVKLIVYIPSKSNKYEQAFGNVALILRAFIFLLNQINTVPAVNIDITGTHK